MNNLELYKVFKTVADTKSFSAAAKKLYITQPAISQGIKQLENDANTTLFIRNSKGVTLTAEGEMLYGYVSSAFDLLSTGEERLIKMKKLLDGELKIGAGDTISEHFILPILEKFHNLYPNIKIQLINR
ncbi:MAG: LysR family transcriptional regulator, partial [Oscillospiraceae bacterium]